jgi:hypothetical protein
MFAKFTKVRTAVCAAVALLFSVGAAHADIHVQGSGKIKVKPDLARIVLAIITEGETAAGAMDANSAAMKRLFEMCKALGIDEKDVATLHYNIQPKYRHVKDSPPVLIGYTVSHEIQVTVHKLDDAGRVLDALVKEGANRVSSITFAVSNPEKYLDEARDLAMADALKKAERLAKGGKVTLGKVKSISELNHAPMEWRYELAAMPKDRSFVPFASGEKDLGVNVNVVFTIG